MSLRYNSSSLHFQIPCPDDPQFPLVIRRLQCPTYAFTACFDSTDQTLKLYFSASLSIPNREIRHFGIEVIPANLPQILTRVKFTKKHHFCCLSPVSLPCDIFIQNLNPLIRSASVPYVGIENMATTCYAAAALQFLLTATPFVELVFKMQCRENTVGAHLQKVFSELLFSESRVHIRQLVFAFGSKSQSLATQEQDSHEFLLELFDELDKDLGKEFELARNRTFSVVAERVVECEEANITKRTEEIASEIQLPVEGCASVSAALSVVTGREVLDGADKWDTGTHRGKCRAERYLRYKSLPPFLIFNLGRYSCLNGRPRELRSFFDCPEELDMKQYMAADSQQCTKYRLVAVVAHRGNVHTGHYIAFCQRKFDGRWFQFNDGVVVSSSFAEIRGTFGFRDNIVAQLWGWLVSGRFVAYLLGYVREDCLDLFATAPYVPYAISPHGTTQYYASLVHHREIGGSKIYGYGRNIEWDDPARTVSELFDEGGLDFFVCPPDTCDGFYGPLDPNSPASDWLVSGFRVNFVAIPSGIRSPVFVVANGDFRGVVDKHSVSDKFGDLFQFRVQGFPVTDFESVPAGAVVFAVPLMTVTLEIDGRMLAVAGSATYADIQKLVSASSASKVLFCDAVNTPIHPRHCPTALQLSQKNPLTARILTGAVTLNSIDLFTPLTIDFYDLNHRKTTQSFLWFRKGRTVRDLAGEIPRWFGFKPDPSYHYVVSPLGRNELVSRIFPEDWVIASERLRVDHLKSSLPRSCTEIRDIFDNNTAPFTTIEVQTVTRDSGPSGWPVFGTVGYFAIDKNSTANTIAKSIGKPAARYFIKGTTEFRPIPIEGKDPLSRLFQKLGDDGTLSGQRPVLLIQIGKPSKK
jgi:ubiquitin C-terminal hydrolase